MIELDLDLNFTNVWWTTMFLVGAAACAVHMRRTWRRWRATMILSEAEEVQSAAFWFMRQNVVNTALGLAMGIGGLFTIFRNSGPHVIHLLEFGALAYMVNKVWNLYSDSQIDGYTKKRGTATSHQAEVTITGDAVQITTSPPSGRET